MNSLDWCMLAEDTEQFLSRAEQMKIFREEVLDELRRVLYEHSPFAIHHVKEVHNHDKRHGRKRGAGIPR